MVRGGPWAPHLSLPAPLGASLYGWVPPVILDGGKAVQLKESLRLAVLVILGLSGHIINVSILLFSSCPLLFSPPASVLDGSAKNQTQINGEKAAGTAQSAFKISSESLGCGVHSGSWGLKEAVTQTQHIMSQTQGQLHTQGPLRAMSTRKQVSQEPPGTGSSSLPLTAGFPPLPALLKGGCKGKQSSEVV